MVNKWASRSWQVGEGDGEGNANAIRVCLSSDRALDIATRILWVVELRRGESRNVNRAGRIVGDNRSVAKSSSGDVLRADARDEGGQDDRDESVREHYGCRWVWVSCFVGFVVKLLDS